MRYHLAMALLAPCAMFWGSWVLAQPSKARLVEAYPTKPVRVVVGLAPGGTTDVHARLVSQGLSKHLGQHFIVDNRPGAGGVIGFLTVTRATPDGYTLLASSPSVTILPAFQEKAPYDPVKDFVPISLVTKMPFLVVVQPSFPANSMAELIEFAKSRPGALNFGLSGIGSAFHLGAVWIISVTKVEITLVPYKGGAPVLNDLLAGNIDATFATPVIALAHVKLGKLRALAVTSYERSRVLPALPTVAESGVTGFDLTGWHGWLAPKGTPEMVVKRLSAAIAKFVKTPEMAEKLATEGAEPVGSTPEQFREFIAVEAQRWRKLVKDTGISLKQ